MNDQRLPAVFSLAMIVATATLGWITLRDDSLPRIADSRDPVPVPLDEQNIVARMWEDPLQAIQTDSSKATTDESRQSRLEEITQSVRDHATDRPVCLLVIPVPATPFPDDLETRMRMRYSIQMALADQGYTPRNRSYLGYFWLPSPALESCERRESSKDGVFIPYEWFDHPPEKKDSSISAGTGQIQKPLEATNNPAPAKLPEAVHQPRKSPDVLVLWLPENYISRQPLRRLANLRENLFPPAWKLDDKLAGLYVIGPRSSDTLQSMVQEADLQRQQASPSFPALSLKEKLAFFSPQATVPDVLLTPDSPDSEKDSPRKGVDCKLNAAITGGSEPNDKKGRWVYFHNLIPTDDQMTDLIVPELERRGLSFREESEDSGILILSEADTSYGRSLPRALAASLDRFSGKASADGGGAGGTQSTWTEAVGPVSNSHLRIYRYLRGLDQQKGQPAAEKQQKSRSLTQSPEAMLAEVLYKDRASAIGESQLDYVDRLANDLALQEKAGGDRKIRAVGILGGDVYDKLILLRTLRARYPNAVFFTTSLDARMWHPDYWRFTRNLIVAAGYDLPVKASAGYTAGEQFKIPPFRDDYQVAVFTACQKALEQSKLSKPGGLGYQPLKTPDPLLFELGKNGPVNLGTASDGKSTFTAGQWKGVRLLTLLILCSILCLAWYLWRRKKAVPADPDHFVLRFLRLFRRERHWFGWWVIGALVFFFTGCVLMSKAAALPGEEPWVLNQGISIWPTEMIRLFVLCAVTVAIVWSLNHRKKVHGDIEKVFFGGAFPNQGPPSQGEDGSKRGLISAYELFKTHQRETRLKSRWYKVALFTVGYLAVGSAAMLIVHGEFPFRANIRGGVSRGIDGIALAGSICAFLWLLFYVLGAAWKTSALLYKIGKGETVWPPECLETSRGETCAAIEDVRWYLDVKFAARTSDEVGRVILLPFAIQLVFAISRSNFIDHWTWPAVLIGIFVCNFILAWIAWLRLRCAAGSVRKEATKHVEAKIRELSVLNVKATEEDRVGKRNRLRGLHYLQKRIKDERTGAYSPVFQDPALLATVLPTGVVGIIAVLFRAVFG